MRREFIINLLSFDISSNHTVNILLIIFKAVPDHKHDQSFNKNSNKFYINKLNDF
jgi:hypothetical protein